MIRRRPLSLASVAVAATSSLLAAGCGGAPPGVASVASSTTAGTATQNGMVAYSACMRSNGVPNFPDPTSSGGIPKQAAVSAFQAVSNARAQAAQNSCRHLLPAGGSLSGKASQPVTVQDRQDYLKAAACLRAHGFTDFPDPTFQNNSVQTNIPSTINQDSPEFKGAATICTKLIPAGLPYSSSGRS
jgi:hypothetical protein